MKQNKECHRIVSSATLLVFTIFYSNKMEINVHR